MEININFKSKKMKIWTPFIVTDKIKNGLYSFNNKTKELCKLLSVLLILCLSQFAKAKVDTLTITCSTQFTACNNDIHQVYITLVANQDITNNSIYY